MRQNADTNVGIIRIGHRYLELARVARYHKGSGRHGGGGGPSKATAKEYINGRHFNNIDPAIGQYGLPVGGAITGTLAHL
jgi:hypothetical protein